MQELVYKMNLRFERDVVKARQRARQMAGMLGFDQQAQIRVATATSEIARNAFRYAKSGVLEFGIDMGAPQRLVIYIKDQGPGIRNLEEIYDGQYESHTGLGKGIIGSRRLMDMFKIQTGPAGTTVRMGADLPKRAWLNAQQLAQIVAEFKALEPEDPFEEVERQNQELLQTLAELRRRQDEVAEVNRELEDTNRGVVALYAELDERAAALRRASDAKTAFLSNMSHEFRTPLNSILSLTRILSKATDGPLTEEQQKQVSYIHRSAAELVDVVNDLLDLAKVEAGKSELRFKKFLVSDLFGALRGVLKPLLHGNSVSLIFDEPAGLPLMWTDEGKVSQILRNLISNALKFTPAGEVRVGAALARDGMVAFSVSDTGIGIAEADRERIFDEFAQVENALQQSHKGTGLGLPLSRNLAYLLCGEIAVRSDVGVGSIFTLTIPVVHPEVGEKEKVAGDEKRPRPSLPLRPVAPRHARAKLLVIDDDEVSRYVLRSFLREPEFLVLEAASGEEGLEIARKEKPDVIFLDLAMPETDGFEVLRALRADAVTRNTPVIIHSSHAVGDAQSEKLNYPAVSIFPKQAVHQPDAADQLRNVLSPLLRDDRGASQI